MSAHAKSDCDQLLTWLRLNLGRRALGALTGTDSKALAAAVHLIRLYAYNGHQPVLEAFRLVVLEMQPSTRQFAFHAIAYVADWDTRFTWWALAGLPPYERIWVLDASPEKYRLEANAEASR
jgi:hypothetical protein